MSIQSPQLLSDSPKYCSTAQFQSTPVQRKSHTLTDTMIALARFALLALVAIVCLALTAEARELLDYYDDCYNGADLISSYIFRHTLSLVARCIIFLSGFPRVPRLLEYLRRCPCSAEHFGRRVLKMCDESYAVLDSAL